MMDKGLINLILSPNPVPSPRAARGRDKRNTSWSTAQCCCGEGVASLNLTKMKCAHLLLWHCRMMKDQAGFLPPSSAHSIPLIFHEISFHNHFCLSPSLFTLFCPLLFHVPLYQQQPQPQPSTTSGIPDSLPFPVINFNCQLYKKALQLRWLTCSLTLQNN